MFSKIQYVIEQTSFYILSVALQTSDRVLEVYRLCIWGFYEVKFTNCVPLRATQKI